MKRASPGARRRSARRFMANLSGPGRGDPQSGTLRCAMAPTPVRPYRAIASMPPWRAVASLAAETRFLMTGDELENKMGRVRRVRR